MREALALLLGGDPELYGIIGRTLLISGTATLIAMLVGVPLGYTLARGRFPHRAPDRRLDRLRAPERRLAQVEADIPQRSLVVVAVAAIAVEIAKRRSLRL